MYIYIVTDRYLYIKKTCLSHCVPSIFLPVKIHRTDKKTCIIECHELHRFNNITNNIHLIYFIHETLSAMC